MPTILTASQARAYMKRRNIEFREPVATPWDSNPKWTCIVMGKPNRPFRIPEFQVKADTAEECLVEAARKCRGYKFSTPLKP